MFEKIISSSIGEVIDKTSEAIDRLFTSDEEKLSMKNELVKIQAEVEKAAMQDSAAFEDQITKRWVSDSGNLITRMVRPLSLVFMLCVFAIMIFFDGNVGAFHIVDAYRPMIETLLTTMVIAYFGSRGIEKTVKIFKPQEKKTDVLDSF